MDILSSFSPEHIETIGKKPELFLDMFSGLADLNISDKEMEQFGNISTDQWTELLLASEDLDIMKQMKSKASSGGIRSSDFTGMKREMNAAAELWAGTLPWLEAAGLILEAIVIVLAVAAAVVTFLGIATVIAAVPATLIAFVIGFFAIVLQSWIFHGAALVFFISLLVGGSRSQTVSEAGGTGGNVFKDIIPNNATSIYEFKIQYKEEDVVTAITTSWETSDGVIVEGATFGGEWSGGVWKTLPLEKNEFITTIFGRQDGYYVRRLGAKTSKGRTFGPFGKNAGENFKLEPALGYVMGFHGRAKGGLDSIGVLSNHYEGYYGGTGGHPFVNKVKGAKRISGIEIRSGRVVDAIKVNWEDKDGKQMEGEQFGGNGGNLERIFFDPDEFITNLEGHAGWYVDSLTIRTNKGQYGPFGYETKSEKFSYSIPTNKYLIGFFGRAQNAVDGLGVLLLDK